MSYADDRVIFKKAIANGWGGKEPSVLNSSAKVKIALESAKAFLAACESVNAVEDDKE